MTTYKELLSKSIGMHVLTTALFFGLLWIALYVDTGDEEIDVIVSFLPSIATGAIGIFAILLSLAVLAIRNTGPIIGVAIMLLAHIMGGLISIDVAFFYWPLAELKVEAELIEVFAAFLAMALHLGWVLYCVWALVKIWKTNKKNQAASTTDAT